MGIFIDPKTLPTDAGGTVQLLFLLAVYGKILMNSSHMISEGSELLLLVPYLAGVVGSVVLPVLGAVPDGAIVLFSGMGENAQEELTIGVGALAGSTIMLLTIPWALSIFGGRVHLSAGKALYRRPPGAPKTWSKVPTKLNMKYNGIGIMPPVRTTAVILLASALNFLIIQIPAFIYASDDSTAALAKDEKPWAMVGIVTTMLSFTMYLLYQWKISGTDEVKNDKIAEVTLKQITAGKISLLGALGPEFEAAIREHHRLRHPSMGGGLGGSTTSIDGGVGGGGGLGGGEESTRVVVNEDYGAIEDQGEKHPVTKNVMERLKLICRPFFHKYDGDKTGTIDMAELALLFMDLGEPLEHEELQSLVEKYDKDKNGHLDFEEFLNMLIDHSTQALHHGHHTKRPSLASLPYQPHTTNDNLDTSTPSISTHTPLDTNTHTHTQTQIHEPTDEEDEEEEIPDDLKHLPWEQQQRRLKLRSFYGMGVGTLLILIFSDPMVGVLSEVGSRTGIPAFYISFILAPVVSNGAEVLAAFAYSQKKSSKTISISLSTLMGAAIMNATFVLAIFLVLIYVKGLAWTFSAETIAILTVQVLIGLMALTRTQNLWCAVGILSLYPISLVLVYVLENVLGFD